MAERLFRLIVPKYDNSGRRIDTDVLRNYAREVAERFGGVSVTPANLGCYVSEAGALQCEENMVIEVTRTGASREQIEEDQDWFLDLARRIGRDLGQESIFLQQETDTATSFVPGQLRRSVPERMIESDFFKKLID